MNSPNHPAVPGWLQNAREQWQNTGRSRPDFAVVPEPGQESVWDYPRPPAVVADTRIVEVRSGDIVIATTTQAIRVLETSHPPSFYVPGQAEYVALSPADTPIGWRYPSPYADFAACAGYVSFYPDAVECRVDGELVRAQAGGFYGGWITNEIVGPFKGETGTTGW